MPEGDTIYRTARSLERALKGRVLIGARSSRRELGVERLHGLVVGDVGSRGKNLLIEVGMDWVVYTHLRMNGSWHLYRPGEAWWKPERQARLVLETDERLAVCFNAPTIEVLRRRDVVRHPLLSRLGPDLLEPEFDVPAARLRLRQWNDLPVGEALLVQSAVSGIGNVYKSEVLFVTGTNPWVRLFEIDDRGVDTLLSTARRLLAQNLKGFPRTTRERSEGRGLWVYGRQGRPCSRCGETIRCRRQGDCGRTTYWCPRCQPRPNISPTSRSSRGLA